MKDYFTEGTIYLVVHYNLDEVVSVEPFRTPDEAEKFRARRIGRNGNPNHRWFLAVLPPPPDKLLGYDKECLN